MQNLYSMIFKSSFHYRIWGGNQISEQLNKSHASEKIGESWEICSMPCYQSIIQNGIYKGLTINNLIDRFGQDFLGTKVYKKFGKYFPLLIKFLATADQLSIQVHPDDLYAKKYHNSFGKNEMWYILDVKEDSKLVIGFNKNSNKEEFLKKLQKNELESILHFVYPKKGETYMIPAKQVHAIGKNLLIVEIQQNSNITYRIYDYNRIDKNGKTRPLHIEQAIQVIDFNKVKVPKVIYKEQINRAVNLVNSSFFITQKLKFNSMIDLNFSNHSFTILIVIEGKITIQIEESQIDITKGRTILFPALLNQYKIKPYTEQAEVLLVRMFN